jgi:hypothetical protein
MPQQNSVMTNSDNWIELLNQIDSINNVSGNFTEIDIDFNNFQIIAIFDDIKPNGGYALDVLVIENENNIKVTITEIIPQDNATTVITQPYIIVKILINSKPIIFD